MERVNAQAPPPSPPPRPASRMAITWSQQLRTQATPTLARANRHAQPPLVMPGWPSLFSMCSLLDLLRIMIWLFRTSEGLFIMVASCSARSTQMVRQILEICALLAAAACEHVRPLRFHLMLREGGQTIPTWEPLRPLRTRQRMSIASCIHRAH
jgi:hypothetical protein